MPIAVSCAHCAASFNVKDEHAGKRGKCPKCGNPVVVPAAEGGPADTVKMPPGAFPARPVAAAKPRPVEDEDDRPRSKRLTDDEDDPPKAKAKRPAVEEDAPRSKRRRDDDAADEKPKAKRRRGDDDDEPKKKSALPLILGILGGLFLLCGGGCAGVYFFVLVPAAEKAKAQLTSPFSTVPQTGGNTTKAEVSRANLEKVKAGMTLAEVEGLLGKSMGRPEWMSLSSRTNVQLPANQSDILERWNPKLREGHVFLWSEPSTRAWIAFTAPPLEGGTVCGVLGDINNQSLRTEFLKAPALIPNPNPQPLDPNTFTAHPEAVLTAAELVKDHAKYTDKWVVVKGKAKKGTEGFGGDDLRWYYMELELEGIPLWFDGSVEGTPRIKAGEEVEVWGKVLGLSEEKDKIRIEKCILRNKVTDVEATALAAEFLRDPAAAEKKYADKVLRITGVVGIDEAEEPYFVGTTSGAGEVRVKDHRMSSHMPHVTTHDRVTLLAGGAKLRDDGKGKKRLVFLGEARVSGVSR